MERPSTSGDAPSSPSKRMAPSSSSSSTATSTNPPTGAVSSSSTSGNGDDNAPPASTTTTKDALLAWIQRDIEPEGLHVLLPFLTTTDRLNLSECCKALSRYRSYLSEITITYHPALHEHHPMEHHTFLPGIGMIYAPPLRFHVREQDDDDGNVIEEALREYAEQQQEEEEQQQQQQDEEDNDAKRARVRAGLDQLLLGQQPGVLEHLHIKSSDAIDVLDLASTGCFRGLKSLDLSMQPIMGRPRYDVGYVQGVLSGGGLQSLEHLTIAKSGLGTEGVCKIVAALKGGSCPLLQRLDLSENDNYSFSRTSSDALGQAMAEALDSGHLSNLRILNLAVSDLGRGGAAALARALERGPCPHLMNLDIHRCLDSVGDGRALASALRSGSCSKLEDLAFGTSHHDDAMAVFQVLGEGGGCPNLKRLNLSNCNMKARAAKALGQALASQGCHQLEGLRLFGNFASERSFHAFLQGIRDGGGVLPSLNFLDIDQEAVDAQLGQAFATGIFPKLENLNISTLEEFDDESVALTLAGLEAGGCRHIKMLRFVNIGMQTRGGLALGRALASGNLACLEHLIMEEPEAEIGDHALAQIVNGFLSCPQLKFLRLGRLDLEEEASQALLQVLGKEGGWPSLEMIELSFNPVLGYDGRDVALGEVLAKGNFRRLKTLYMKDVGFSEEGFRSIMNALTKERFPLLYEVAVEYWSVEKERSMMYYRCGEEIVEDMP